MSETRRTPDQILRDLDQLDTSFCDDPNVTVRGLIWEVIEDIRSSYRLAIDDILGATLSQIGIQEGIEVIVDDYLANHYGDD